MIKKLVVAAVAAGAMAIPLAGAAWADPAPDNPGVPGNLGSSPGAQVSRQIAQIPDSSTAGWIRDVTNGAVRSPGQLISSQFAPGHNKP